MATPGDPTINFPGSPDSNRGFQPPRSGPNNVAEYMASGLPFSQQVAVSASTDFNQIDFPFVTSEIYVKNRGSGPLAVGWTANGVRADNKHTLLQDEAITFRVRVKSIFLTGVSGAGIADVTAAMTQISHLIVPVATGSAADPVTGEFGFVSTSLDRIWGWDGIG